MSVAHALDLNNNGMSDIWEARYGLGSSSSAEDLDGDGYNNLQESLLGTDPHRADSKLSVTVQVSGTGQARLELALSAAKRYQIEKSADLLTWAPASPAFLAPDSAMEIPVDVSATRSDFYRCNFVGDLDQDGDELSAWEESQLGSGDDDSRNNGLPDWWELEHFGHSHVDPAADEDQDGVSNGNEFLARTNPVPQGPVITLELPAQAVEER